MTVSPWWWYTRKKMELQLVQEVLSVEEGGPGVVKNEIS